MWNGHLARHRQDACTTSFTSQMSTLYFDSPRTLMNISQSGANKQLVLRISLPAYPRLEKSALTSFRYLD